MKTYGRLKLNDDEFDSIFCGLECWIDNLKNLLKKNPGDNYINKELKIAMSALKKAKNCRIRIAPSAF